MTQGLTVLDEAQAQNKVTAHYPEELLQNGTEASGGYMEEKKNKYLTALLVALSIISGQFC